jgi:antitoxin ParD1/3/4
MPIRKSISISLSPELQAVAEGLMISGRYGNISDVMRAALRLLEERELEFVAFKAAKAAAPRAQAEHKHPMAGRSNAR